MKTRVLIRLFIITLLFGIYFATGTPIDGKWYASGVVGEEEEAGGFGWYLQYEFKRGRYTMEGYPPISEEGHYSVEENEDGSYSISFEKEDESGELSQWVWQATLSEEKSTLSVKDGNTFTRTN